ncbi:MAG: sirohydrochlorin cobaltochelatase [Desulforhopalus sp.]|nr:sirohydrochlorin cobaltochelatase [Desulforhopalus sp.]
MNRHGYIGRKVHTPELKEKPAIIIVSFGTSSRSEAVLDLFTTALEQRWPEHRIFHAFTSAVIRRKSGNPSLHEALAHAEAENFRRVVIQPLQIFPGTEYQQIVETCEFFPGLRSFLGETLMHRWNYIEEVLKVLEQEFLPPSVGLNLLALHGTPLAADPANIVYLGLERLIHRRYSNVCTASLEGTPDFTGLRNELVRDNAAGKFNELRIIPLLYFAGQHAEDDLMGEGETSWKSQLTAIGFDDVTCLTTTLAGSDYYKGLGYYPEIIEFFLQRLARAMGLAERY